VLAPFTSVGLLVPHIDGRQVVSKKALAVAGSEEYEWVAALTFLSISAEQNRLFIQSELLRPLIGLHYLGCDIGPSGVEELVAVAKARRYQFLSLARTNFDCRLLGELASLRELKLIGSDIGSDAGFKLLCDSRNLNELQLLDISNTELSIHAARAFADRSGLPALAKLNLAGNRIGPDGTLIMVHSPNTGRLQKLNLSMNGIADYGVEAICGRTHMSNLTHLDLSGNLLTDRAATAIAGAQHLEKLEELNLTLNDIGDDGAMKLASAAHLTDLRRLDLTSNHIGPNAAASLRERFGDRVKL
jgi:Leucine-rich repeat (LRR) protein